MSNQRAAEIRETADDELFTELADAKAELFNLRFQLVTGQLDNYARVNQVKKDIARINTVLREREIIAAEAAEAEMAGDASEQEKQDG